MGARGQDNSRLEALGVNGAGVGGNGTTSCLHSYHCGRPRRVVDCNTGCPAVYTLGGSCYRTEVVTRRAGRSPPVSVA